jgi:hypothetical protein
MPRMITPCSSIVITSAITRPSKILVRRMGLVSSFSSIPLSMSLTVANPDCSAVNSIDSTTMPGRKNSR